MRATPKSVRKRTETELQSSSRRRPVVGVLVGVCLALLATLVPLPQAADAAFSCTIRWDGDAGTSDWHHSLNWTGDRLPGASDVVCVDASVAGQAVVLTIPTLTEIGALQTDNQVIIKGGELRTAWKSYTAAFQIEAGALVLGDEFRTDEFNQLGGVVEGTGTLAVTGFLRWEGGEQWGPGRTTISDAGGGFGGLLMETAGTRRALGRPIDANQGMVIEGGSLALDGQGSVLTLGAPSGALEDGGTITGDGRIVANSKLIVQDSILDISPRFDTSPTGQVEVRGDDSVLATYGGGEHEGDFVIADAGSLQLRGGLYDFHESSTIDGADNGNFQIAEETTDAAVVGRVNVASLDVLAGSLRLDGSGNELGTVDLFGGKLRIEGEATAAQLDQDGGTVGGAGELTVEGDFGWAKGDQEGTGDTVVLGKSLVGAGGDGRKLVDRTVDNASLEWIESGKVTMAGEAELRMGKTTFADGVEVDINGTGVVAPGTTDIAAERLTIKPRLEVYEGEHVTITNDDAFVDLQGGGIIDGVVDGANGSAVVFGGEFLIGEHANLSLAHSQVGTYDTAYLTISAPAVVFGDMNFSGTVRVEHLLNGGHLVNHGTFEIADGATVWIDDFEQMDEENVTLLDGANATLDIVGPAYGGTDTVTINLGDLDGSGKIDGNLVNIGGVVEPSGEMDVTGNYTQSDQGELSVFTDGNTVDRLTIGGSASLDGSLAVEIEGDPATQPLNPLTASIITGEFNLVYGADECWDIDYLPTDVFLVPQPCVIIGAGSGVEDLGVVSFPVTLSTPHAAPVVVTYAAQNDTAVVGEDFEATSGSITLQPGQTEGVITVNLVGDDDDEPNETFNLAVSAAGGRVATDRVVGTIIDDDDEEQRAELEYEVEDIPVRGEWSDIQTSSRKYIVGTTDFDHFGTKFSWYYNLSTATFSYWDDVVWATDLNEKNELVGSCGEPVLDEHSCFRSGKTNYDVDTPSGFSGGPNGLNDTSQLVGSITDQASHNTYAALWTPDTLDDPYSIGGPDGATNSSAIDISDTGVVLGESTLTAARQPWVWTEASGFTVIPSLPGMPYMRAADINDHGMVVGSAADSLLTPTQTHAWSWTKKGGLVDLGAGAATGTNADDDIVGVAAGRGVLWRDGELHNLDDTLPEGSPWRIVSADTINDNGVIGVMAYDGAYLAPLALKSPQPPCTICITAKTEQRQYPTGEWVPGDGEIVEGTPMRVTAKVQNTDVFPKTVLVTIEDENGDPIGEESSPITIAPGGSKEITVDRDTEGLAWENGQPAGLQFVEFNAYADDGTPLDNLSIGTEFVPKPVVLAHGLWSDASTWASYQQFLASKHPGWKAYAIDTMDTTSFTPNLVSENANLLDNYIRQVQESQNAWQVDLVGHSMGGIISRFYIQEFMTQLPDENGQPQNAVAHLVMLGTPNGGSPCADLAIVPATYELRPDVQAEFNAHINDYKGVPFSLAAGLDLPMTCHMPLPGDDVVPVESAQLGMTDTQLFEIAHTDMTGSRMLFDQWVAPHLIPIGNSDLTADPTLSRGASSADFAPPTPALPAEPVAKASAALSTDPAELLVGGTHSLASGASKEIPVRIDNSTTELGALALAPSALEVQLVRDGQVIETTGNANGTAIGFRSVDVPNPGSDKWSVVLVNHGPTALDVPLSVWARGLEGTFTVHAEQIGTAGAVQITATTDLQFSEGPQVTADVIDGNGNVRSVELADDGAHGDGSAGDRTFGQIVKSLGSGGHLAVVRLSAPFIDRMATDSVHLTVVGDTPGVNDAPTAVGQSVTVGRNTSQNQLVLEGADADGDAVQYLVKDLPTHGVLQQSGTSESIRYIPTHNYMGTDSFTFRTFDGVLYSAPTTVNIVVGKMPTTTTYSGPWPSTGAAGTSVEFQARVMGPNGDFPSGATVDFALGGTTVSAEVNTLGYARADVTVPVTPGTYPLTMTFQGDATSAPSSTTHDIVAFGGAPPAPKFMEPVNGEAGYLVRMRVNPIDPDDNASTFQLDFEDDGTWDATLNADDFDFGFPWVDHIYPAAFDGIARVKVTDTSGQSGEATAPVHIAPHRPLGALRMLRPGDNGVRGVDISADGGRVLYQVTDTEDGNQLPTPIGVVDPVTGEHELVSKMGDGSPVPFPGGLTQMSDNGRFVGFDRLEWAGGDIMANIGYVRDTETGEVTKVSLTDDDVPPAYGAEIVDISDDGQTVLLSSDSTDMTDNDPDTCGTVGQNNSVCDQLYIRDVVAGTTTAVSIDPDGSLGRDTSWMADLTPDGNHVVFTRDITEAIDGYDVTKTALTVWDRDTGVAEELDVTFDDHPLDWDSAWPSLSSDGRYVVFSSRSDNIVPGDTNQDDDVFRHDRTTGQTILVSSGTDGAPGDARSYFAATTCDASMVVFTSAATDLVAGDTNDTSDVFLRDLNTGATRRVSVEARDGTEGNQESAIEARISSDGSHVLFNSLADNLVPGDVTGHSDAFLFSTGQKRSCTSGEEPDPEPTTTTTTQPEPTTTTTKPEPTTTTTKPEPTTTTTTESGPTTTTTTESGPTTTTTKPGPTTTTTTAKPEPTTTTTTERNPTTTESDPTTPTTTESDPTTTTTAVDHGVEDGEVDDGEVGGVDGGATPSSQDGDVVVAVAGVEVEAASGELPITGADSIRLALVGLAALAGGLLLVRVGRRRDRR